jgi:sterol desaturase/sphingolipid hydroxylase (fatty acid hydroxylase superfamily)
MRIDKPLLALASLLALVLAAYLFGWIPWPFGILIILILLVARVSHIQTRRFRKGGHK